MKTKMLFMLLVVFSAGTLKAQTEFAPIGATWYCGKTEAMWGDEGYLKVTSADTTIIDGRKVKVLMSEYHWSKGGVGPWDTIYAYQTGDSVLFYLDGDFHLVYNFGLNVGDTMEIYNPENKICGDDWLYEHVMVESIKTLNINGTELKKFSLIPTDSHSYYYQYIEKIGTTYQLFRADCYVGYDDTFLGGFFGSLRCYEDSEIGHYQFGETACDSLYVNNWTDPPLRIDIIDKEDLDLSIIYSHSDKAIVVDSHGSCDQSVINVFDVNGIMLYSDICKPDTHKRIALKRNGFYMVVINNNIGTYYEKIIAY